ncbi:MAG: DUF4855 domain-containing protein, partial [Bacteroidota bacterium]
FPTIFLDDLYLAKDDIEINLLEDFSFDAAKEDTKWERSKLESDLAVYTDRSAVIPAIESALDELESRIGSPRNEPLKLFVSFPEISAEAYTNPGDPDPSSNPYIIDAEYSEPQTELGGLTEIHYYLNTLNSAFTSGSFNNVELAGVYLTSERLADTSPEYLAYIDYVEALVNSYGWVFVGAPFNKLGCDQNECGDVKSQYDEFYFESFDQLWQQPNAFSRRQPSAARQVVDRDILRFVGEYVAEESQDFGIQMEYNTPIDNLADPTLTDPYHPYHRLFDYMDNGKKYGYINYYRGFIDDEGDFFNLALSDQDDDKDLYNAVYQYIKDSQQGCIINSTFEHIITSGGDNVYHHWMDSDN